MQYYPFGIDIFLNIWYTICKSKGSKKGIFAYIFTIFAYCIVYSEFQYWQIIDWKANFKWIITECRVRACSQCDGCHQNQFCMESLQQNQMFGALVLFCGRSSVTVYRWVTYKDFLVRAIKLHYSSYEVQL